MSASEDPVQAVFNSISLRRNAALWLSADDARLGDRLKLLLQHEETKFADLVGKSRNNVSSEKSEALASSFARKSQELLTRSAAGKHDEQLALTCLNRALVLAPKADQARIYAARADVLGQLGHEVERRQDLEVLQRLKGECLEQIHVDEDESCVAGFSPLVKVATDPANGRYLMAEGDIPAGTLLATDRPLLRVLRKEFMKTHCWNCLKEVGVAVFPCEACSDVVFCRPRCAEEAVLYHKSECGKVQLLYSAELGTWLLAFRALALRDTASSPAFAGTMDLVTHYGSDLFSAPELMKEALVAVFLARVWAASSHATDEQTEAAALFAHKVMRVARFNSHEVVWRDAQGRLKVVGFAVNPLLALANHSCDSNYGRVWLGGHTALAFSTRPIAQGMEVSDSYSGVYAYSVIEERRVVHARYHFECACAACAGEWPVKAELNASIKDLPPSALRSSGARVKELAAAVKAKAEASSDVESARMLLELAYEVLLPPHALLVDLEDRMHSLLWAKASKSKSDV